MNFQYWFEMPSQWTFTMPKIQHYLLKIVQKHTNILIPFAGQFRFPKMDKSWTYIDINPESPSPCLYGDVLTVLPAITDQFDLIISDPPYSFHQAHTTYKNTDMIQMTAVKTEYDRLLKGGGQIIHFGFNSTGMGKTRNYVKQELCIVNQGGNHNDILILREQKSYQLQNKSNLLKSTNI
jgi:hypothetical protein